MPTLERCRRISKIAACPLIILLTIAIVVVIIFVVLPDDSNDNNFCQDPPPNISFSHNGYGIVRVSWDSYLGDEDCNVSYYFMFRYEGVEWNFHTAESFVVLESLYECSVLLAHLWTINGQGQFSTYYTEGEFDVTAPNQQINDIYIEEWGDALSVTWHKPQNLSRCQVTYQVAYSSQLADETTNIEDPAQLIIPFEKYCFHLTIQINVSVNSEHNSFKSHEYNTKADIRGYKVRLLEDIDEFLFTWDSHFKEELCSLEYRVSYHTLTNTPVIVTTTVPEARFKFVYCQFAWINMDVVTSNGDIADATIGTLYVTLAPNNITDISGVDIDTHSSTDEMIISWEYPQLANDCYVRYDVNITTDAGTFTNIDVVPPIKFPKDRHCGHLELEFVVIVLGVPSQDSFIINYDIAPEPVENFVVTQTTDSYVVVSWDPHSKEKLCHLQYRLVRIVNGAQLEPVETELNSYTFEFDYCVDTQIRITAFIGNHESEFVSIDATQCNSKFVILLGLK